MTILVIRFRQMGDAILATPLLATLREQYPDAQIDFVLNERLAPLFEGHPAISRIITFTDEERHSPCRYVRKVWRIVHQTRYDAIIDMRSTANTMLFPLLSLRSQWRIGISKPYTLGICNRRIPACAADESMVDHNLRLAEPILSEGAPRRRELSLPITPSETNAFRQYMQQQGVDFSRPVLLVGVTAKLPDKTWPAERMTAILARLIEARPCLQLVFNYAPGKEAAQARDIFERLDCPANVFLNVEASTPRQLAAMAACCTAYFGNEGGARHVAHAMRRPSLVVCSPGASKATWLPTDSKILTMGLAATDIRSDAAALTPQQQYSLITVERLWPLLQHFCDEVVKPRKPLTV